MMKPAVTKIVAMLGMVLLVACVPGAEDKGEDLVIPTAITTVDESSTPTPPAFANLPAAPTFEVATPSPTERVQIPFEPTAQADEGPPRYAVAFVQEDDVLNIRSGPGVDYDVVAELPPDAAGIEITGPGRVILASTWVPIRAGLAEGWVNGRFLAQVVTEERFCQEQAVTALLERLQTAIEQEDGALLAQLVHPERGLKVRHAWWNPEVLASGSQVVDLFDSPVILEWGVEDGSGLPIIGPFKDKILPLLKSDLLEASEMACDEILHGGTAGFVRLPDGYEQVHFYSYHRPGSKQYDGLDWGSWVVGVEKWQEAYYLSFLVHFAWEI